MIIGIIDGSVAAYDISSLSLVQQLTETKDCSMFAVNERTSLLCVAGKKKFDVFVWQGTQQGFVHRKEISRSESPRGLFCLRSGTGAVVGNKRSYDHVDLVSGAAPVKLLDLDREHKMVGIELPAIKTRSSCYLLSNVTQGVLVDMAPFLPLQGGGPAGTTIQGRRASRPSSTGLAGRAGATTATVVGGNSAPSGVLAGPPPPRADERLEWSSLPIALQLQKPFIVSLLKDCVEIHDLVTLSMLQRLNLTSAPALTPINNAGTNP